jgi:hypothetical protein
MTTTGDGARQLRVTRASETTMRAPGLRASELPAGTARLAALEAERATALRLISDERERP